MQRGPSGLVKRRLRWWLGHALPWLVLSRAAKKGDLHGRFVTGAARSSAAETFRLIEEIRAEGPLVRGAYAWMTTSNALTREVLTSPDFQSGFEPVGDNALARASRWANDPPVLGPLTPPSLLVTEPPDHTRYRKLVTRVFTVRAVEQLRGRAEEIAHGLLDDLSADSTIDLVPTYCSLLPVTLIAEILGVPYDERDVVLRLGAAAAPSLDLGLGWREFTDVEDALIEFDGWLTRHLARLQREPGDDLMSQLVAAREDGAGLSDAELKSTAGLVLAAGFETTVNLLGNGIALLVEHPEQLARLRAEPELWPTAVDEILRIDPPVLLTGRMATRDTEVAGTRIPAGAIVTTMLAGANRDPEVFTGPAAFDVARPNAREHVSFSAGRHYCLGASLARMEGEVGLRLLFERYPDLALAPGAVRRPTRILRGYAALPARLTR